MPNQKYNEQQSRFERAFRGVTTLCVVDCQCGRIHFVSAAGHGDYEEGELEKLQAKAVAEPDKYVEESTYDTVDAAFIDGKQIVVDCPCDGYKRYCDWIESHADNLAVYLREFFEDRLAQLKRQVERDAESLQGLKT